MPVFISYERHDEPSATAAYAALRAAKITAYLDLLDPNLKKGENATSAILSGVEKCTHLLTIVSQTTKSSWWVPFEVGAATRSAKRITTYRRDSTVLPDYLTIWPVVNNLRELDRFIVRYFQDRAHSETNYTFAEARYKTLNSAPEFHAALKRDLGQL